MALRSGVSTILRPSCLSEIVPLGEPSCYDWVIFLPRCRDKFSQRWYTLWGARYTRNLFYRSSQWINSYSPCEGKYGGGSYRKNGSYVTSRVTKPDVGPVPKFQYDF